MKELENTLDSLLGLPVFKIVAGGSNGSIIILYFGERKSQKSLSIYCSWRLSKDNEVLTGSNESSRTRIPKSLKKLKNLHLAKFVVSSLYDLTLEFTDGICLNIFCDITAYYPQKNYNENWYLADDSQNIVFTITNKFEIVKDKLSPFEV